MYTQDPASALAGFTYRIQSKNAKAATLTAMIAAIPFQRLRDSSAGTTGIMERRSVVGLDFINPVLELA
jgi:hypothetical protein